MRVVLSIGLVLAACAVAGAGTVVVANGKAQAVVVTAAEPSAVARYAAGELVHHVAKATGVTLAIAAENAVPQAPAGRIYVGPCEAARRAGIDAAKLSPEEFALKSVGGALFIVGRDGAGGPMSVDTHAGTMWGVYELLEDVLGVRWLWPGELGIHAPKTDRVVVPALDRRVKPWLLQRQLRPGLSLRGDTSRGFSSEGFRRYERAQRVFLRRHRMGRVVRFRYGHAFNAWWKRYGKDHPDWFQLLPDGRRGPVSLGARYSMCVSNPGYQRRIVENWKKRRAANPGVFLNINCCENDIRGQCTCKRCQAQDGPQPDKIHPRFGPRVVSDRYARSWLAVQQLAAKEDPEATVVAYAYVNYAPPPSLSIKLNPHVIVGTVPDLFFPRTAEGQRWVLEQWDGWARTGARMFLRPNYFLGGYCMPHIFAHQFAHEFRHEAANGMTFTDFDSLTGQWATQGANLYVLVRLHTRPQRTADQLLDEYYSAFGPAASDVKAYFDYWEAFTSKHVDEMGIVNWSRYAASAHKVFPAEAFAPAERILAEAAKAVAGDPTAAARVAFLRTGLQHARLAADLSASVREGHPVPARRTLSKLMAFRRAHEAECFSNLHFCSYIEGRSWRIPEGYNGEALRPVADAPAALGGTPIIPIRKQHMCVVLLKKGERLQARVACHNVGRFKDAAEWRVYGPDDALVARGSVPMRTQAMVDVPATADGPHLLTLGAGGNVVRVSLLSPHAALTGRTIRLLETTAPLHFWVPKGVRRFTLAMESPAPGETAKMTVRDPDGKVVAELATGKKKQVVARLTVPKAHAGRAWSVVVGKGGPGVLEDYSLTLDKALPGYWSLAADRLVVPAK